jgi:predicted nucleotidyltransferase
MRGRQTEDQNRIKNPSCEMNLTSEELAANFGELNEVEAVVLAGSAATGRADEWSDQHQATVC